MPIDVPILGIKTGPTNFLSFYKSYALLPINRRREVNVGGGRRIGFSFTITPIYYLVVSLFYNSMQPPRSYICNIKLLGCNYRHMCLGPGIQQMSLYLSGEFRGKMWGVRSSH